MTAAKRAADVTSEPVPEPKDAGTSRIGLIVPSSNTTMETELPELFRRQRPRATGTLFTRPGPA
jgi:maleate isomerase